MIIGIGTDIVSISRMEKAIRESRFIERVFTASEIEYANKKGTTRAASFAARFAAKEAVLKAFGTGLRGGELKEIEVEIDNLGAPHINLYGNFLKLANDKGVISTHISLSHEREYATAFCVMEGNNENSFKK